MLKIEVWLATPIVIGQEVLTIVSTLLVMLLALALVQFHGHPRSNMLWLSLQQK